MKNFKKLSLAFLVAVSFSSIESKRDKNNDDQDNHMTSGEVITAPFAFATNLGVDAVTLDQTHQTRKYIDRNSRDGNPHDTSMSAGEGLLSPVAVTTSGVTGQGHEYVERNSSSKKKRSSKSSRSSRSKRSKKSKQQDEEINEETLS